MDPIRFLAAVRARLKRTLAIEGLARVLAIVLTVAVLAVAADWLWHLPGGVRLGLLAGVGAAAAAIVQVRLVRPFRRDLGDRALAAFVERRAPGLDGRLLSAVDGIALGAADEAILAERLAALDPRALVPARRTPKQLLITGGALAAVALIAGLAPQTAADGAKRLLLPLGEAQWHRHTLLSATLEHPVVAADGVLTLAIARRNPDPAFSAPVLVAWRGGRIDESRQLGGLTGTAWTTAIAGPPGTYAITVASGDAEPVTVSGRIVARPAIARVRAILTPPAYTGLPAQRVDTLAGSVIPGTTVEFSLAFASEPGRAVTTAAARFNDAAIPLTAGDSGWSGRFTVGAAGTVTVEAADQDGIGLGGEPRFPLTVTPDRPPVVSLAGPVPREAVSVRAVIDLSLSASDDFGLGGVELRAQTLHAEPEAKSAAKPPAEPSAAKPAGELLERFTGVAGQTSVTRATSVEVGRHAAEGEQLALTGRATDRNDVSGPGIGESEPLVLRVVPEDILRQEFDRLLGEAKDRVTQARDDLAAAADDPARRVRSATQTAAKAEELTAQVLRRWDQNRLAADAIAPARKARTMLAETALPRLAEAGAGAEEPRRAADAALAEAERALASLLQEGDLTRLLTSLIARQTALGQETRGFVRAFLTRALDPAGKALQVNLSSRQREVADLVLEVERRLLAKEGGAWTKAQDLVRKEAPGDRLRAAGQDLAANDRRSAAVEGQQAGLATLQRLLDALRGGDAAKDLIQQTGVLAEEQERLAKELERGTAPGALAARQKELAERTQALARAAEAQDPQAAKILDGATAAEKSAERNMQRGDAPSAGRDAGAAAGMLREAQKQLGGANQDPNKQKPEEKKLDILALLKELRTLQAALITDETLLDRTVGEKVPDFAAARQVLALARAQTDIRLRLTEEAIKPLDKNPIALLALERVDQAMDASARHLTTPALGGKGLRLSRTALAELARLIEVAEDMPTPDKKDGGKPSNGGDGGGQAPQAPFPPQAEIALLAAFQQELARRTSADHPGDLAGQQHKLQELVEGLARTVRPGTRPAVLLERTRRAMTSAAYQLGEHDRGVLTRHEQEAAEVALRRLLAEADGGDGGGGSGQQKPQPPAPQQAGQGKPPPGKNAGDPGGQQAPSQGGDRSGTPAQTATLPVQAQHDNGDLLQLPPAIREQIRQAREQSFTPGQLQVYQRYLEVLEESK